jgi:UDP-N-acetylmuramyl pentapeptide synthase
MVRKFIDLLELLWTYPSHLDAFLRKRFDRAYPVIGRLAYAYRRLVIPRKRLIIVVGSLGKTTTTRALRAALLETDHYQSFSNYGSRLAENVLRSRPFEPRDVLEVGISGRNQMDRPARLIQPNIVVVTSIKSDHNRSFPTLKHTRREKVKMVQALSSDGVAVLNGDDPNVRWMAKQTQAKVVTYGLSPAYDVWASDLELCWPEGSSFTLHAQGEIRQVRVRLIGEQMIYAILAAVAVAVTEGFSLDHVLPRLEALEPARARMEPVFLDNGVTFIDDSFKAPLESMHAALDTLARIPAKRRIVVLGSVEEPPGPQGPIYRELGARIAACADLLLFVPGQTNLRRLRIGAEQAGMPRTSILHASNRMDEAIKILQSELRAGDVVLLKGASAGRYRRILLGLQGKDVQCTVKSCRVKVFFCEECPLLGVDTNQIQNSYIRRLFRDQGEPRHPTPSDA